MRLHPKAAAIVLVALTVPLLASCSDDDGGAAEEPADTVVAGEVDLDEGTVRITDEDGTVSEFDPTAELPEDWPDELRPPEAVTISSATRQTIDGTTSLVAFGEAQGTVEDYLAGLRTQFAEAGLEIGNESQASGSGSEFATLSGTGPAYDVTATITADGGADVVSISLSITLAS